MKIIFFTLIILSFSFIAVADVRYDKEISSFVGMNMVTFAEDPKAIEGENVDEPFSGSLVGISGAVQLNLLASPRRNYYLVTSFPLMTSPQLYINAAFGVEYFLNDVGSKFDMFNSGTSISITPAFRYYVSAEIGVGYLVYNTEDATKSDVLFEIGGGAGMGYTISENWALKMKVTVAKGSGVVTSSFTTSAFFGATRFIDL